MVTAQPLDPDRLPARLAGRIPEGAQVRVLAPVTELSRMQWLANEDDAAREQAERVAAGSARVLEAATPAPTHVEDAGAGDVDVVQAIEDELVSFPADEILIVAGPPEEQPWLVGQALDRLAQLDVPVRRITVDAA